MTTAPIAPSTPTATSAAAPITVLVVEDQTAIGEMLARFVAAQPGFVV